MSDKKPIFPSKISKTNPSPSHQLQWNLPYADVPSIIQSNDKDIEIQDKLFEHLQNLIQLLFGQTYVKTNLNFWKFLNKSIYFGSTTLLNKRTPGEEYADIIINDTLSTSFKRRNKLFLKRFFFIMCHIGGIKFLLSKIKSLNKFTSQTTNKLDFSLWLETLSDLHLALFYLNSKYYEFIRRIFQMRYFFLHDDDSANEENNLQFRKMINLPYKIVGGVIILKLLYKGVFVFTKNTISAISSGKNKKEISENTERGEGKNAKKKILTRIPLESKINIDLEDPLQLPYIQPDSSRTCVLCLSYMKNPSCGKCGHLFCWNCIMDWCREAKNATTDANNSGNSNGCPLCRQELLPQQIVPLR
ncbi:ubiquitin-protein ligase peroxin 10 SCDLUD_004709 [Saccharomycodes ludwigii]|uniref:ubiquitin-protein ligase peroxin 10 n=1 Tax=Saccharomycodes ludwigii TaxID=36035 RepID=UPI001E85D44A|nr:hypothetical protein SCDLUD_004709 [Saccharomycodes ludwigii]KAH3899273.1 hypothetical protein SCDLUD_004709 [Saccharomycodes ludwigii]